MRSSRAGRPVHAPTDDTRTLAGMASSVVAYWVGSSNGSMQKNAALEKELAQK